MKRNVTPNTLSHLQQTGNVTFLLLEPSRSSLLLLTSSFDRIKKTLKPRVYFARDVLTHTTYFSMTKTRYIVMISLSKDLHVVILRQAQLHKTWSRFWFQVFKNTNYPCIFRSQYFFITSLMKFIFCLPSFQENHKLLNFITVRVPKLNINKIFNLIVYLVAWKTCTNHSIPMTQFTILYNKKSTATHRAVVWISAWHMASTPQFLFLLYSSNL
jgi:hypothetical protein